MIAYRYIRYKQMVNEKHIILFGAVVAVAFIIIVAGASDTTETDLEDAANNTTGPPPAYTFKPPLWIVPVAGVIAGIIGLVAGVGQTHD